MQIGIDARMYGPKQGGLGRYIQQLILNLEKTDSKNEYVIFLRRENWDEYTPSAPNFKKVLADVPWYGWAEQIKLPKIFKKANVDLMHFPHWNVPIFYGRPFVVTIHDLLLLHYPTRAASTLGPISYFFKNLAYRRVLNYAARYSKKIIAPCEFVKNDVIKTLKINPEKISVTLLAPRDHLLISPLKGGETDVFSPPFKEGLGEVSPSRNLQSSIFNLPPLLPTQPYILYVGVAFPHKNLLGLIKAWKIFNEKYDIGYKLVLVGKENYFYRQLKNHPLVKQLKNKPIFTDFIPDNQLPYFYQNAALYVFPSFYEGFGLPPLEAMQYDLPVVSSDRTCLPEILKNAAVYFDPDQPELMARVIHDTLNDQKLTQTLIANAKNLLKLYSWDNTARATQEIYKHSG